MIKKLSNIENLKSSLQIVAAPMAGVSTPVFRGLCRRMGATICFSEMISSTGLIMKNIKTRQLLSIWPDEHPVCAQIFGTKPDEMGESATIVEEAGFDIIDINMGCPVRKIITSGAGAALMNNPALASRIVKTVVRKTGIPVTAKIRTGWDKNNINAVIMAKTLEDAGVSAIIVHGRTREQGYSGRADWDIISEVKDNVTIPVVGNGDIVDGASALEGLRRTGCDGLMIGRASLGNPWIFKEVSAVLSGEEIPPSPSGMDRYKVFLHHFFNVRREAGRFMAIHKMKKFASWYIKGCCGAPMARRDIHFSKTSKEMIGVVKKVLMTN